MAGMAILYSYYGAYAVAATIFVSLFVSSRKWLTRRMDGEKSEDAAHMETKDVATDGVSGGTEDKE